MKKYIKKITACILIIGVVISSFVFSKATSSDADKPSKVLLEAMLNNRSWVLDTIVDGNYSSHPFMDCQNFDDYTYPIFQRVEESALLKTLITTCEYVLNNPLDTVLDFLMSRSLADLELMVDLYNLVIPEEFIDDKDYICKKLIDCIYDSYDTKLEKHYEYVFNGMFTAEYESEFQTSLAEEEVRVSEYQTLADHQKNVSKAITDLKKIFGGSSDVLDSLKMNYADKFLGDYKVTLNKYFELRSKYTKDANMTDKSNLINSVYSASLTQQSQFGVFDGNASSEYSTEFEKWRTTYQIDSFMSKAKKVISAAGAVVSLASSVISNCLLLESLQYQKESTIDGLRTLYNHVDKKEVKDIVHDYLELIDGTYDEVTLNFKNGFDALWDSNIIQDAAKKGIVKIGSDYLAEKVSLAASKLVSSAVVSFNTSVIVGEVITGALKTSEKFFQIESAMTLIDAMKEAYADDLAKYKSNKTEENARKVLNDLMFLKKLRLFTCQMIYDSASHQLGTPIGAIITGFSVKEDDQNWVEDIAHALAGWKSLYQNQIDILHSATLDPIASTPLELSAGDELNVYVDKNYAILERENKKYVLCEIAERLLGGLKMDNANVIFYSSSGNREFHVPVIFTNGYCGIKTADVSLTVLGLYHEGEQLGLEVSNDIIFVNDFRASGGSVYHSGSGRVIFKGDVIVDDGHLQDVLIAGDKDQTITPSSPLWIDNLTFAKPSGVVTVNDYIYVWDSLKNPSTTVKAGSYLVLMIGGVLIGNHCEGDVALDGHTFNSAMSFGGELYTYNQTVFNSTLKVKNYFSHYGTKLKIAGNAEVGDFSARGSDGSVVQIGGNLTSGRDIHISSSECTFAGAQNATGTVLYNGCTVNAAEVTAGENISMYSSHCTFTGNLEAGIEVHAENSEVSATNVNSGELTEIDESNFTVTGKSISGDLNVSDSVVNIHEAETSGDATVKNSQYTIETKQYISGNLHAEGGTVNMPVAVIENDFILKTTEFISSDSITARGTLTSNSSNLQSENTFVNGDLYLNKGTFTVNDMLTMRGDYSSKESTINIKNMVIDGYTAQVIEGQELYPETLTVKNLSSQGAIINSGIFVSGMISNPYGKISGNVYVTAMEGCSVENGKYNGNLTLSEASWVADKYDISGNLKMNGNTSLEVESIEVGGTVIYDGTSSVDSTQGTLTVNATDLDIGYLDQASGTVDINAENITCQNDFVHKNLNMTADKMTVKGNLKHPSETAEYNVTKLTVESDFIQQGNITNNGKIIVEGEAKISGTHSGGELELKQDANVGEGVDAQSIVLSGRLQQMISGISAKTVDLHFDNSSKDGITVCCPINVSGEFFNNAKKVNGLSYIKIGTLNSGSNTQIDGDFNIDNWICTEDTVVGGDLNISGTLTVNPGVVLTVEGTVNNSSAIVLNGATLIVKESVSNSGSITLKDSACLIIEDSAYFKSGTVTVDETSELVVTEDSLVTSTIENNGKLKFNDIYFKSGTVKGIGTYEFCGDVRSDGAVFERINVVFNSRFRQSVSGKEFTFNNITINNSSKDGLVIETAVNYYGALEKNNSVIRNYDKLVSKEV